MRLLLDENLDRRLKHFFSEEHEVVTIRERSWGAPLSLVYSGAKTARSSSGESKVSSSPISFPSRVTAGGSTWVRARASSRPKTVLGSSSISTLPYGALLLCQRAERQSSRRGSLRSQASLAAPVGLPVGPAVRSPSRPVPL